jgi:hypothetical protein
MQSCQKWSPTMQSWCRRPTTGKDIKDIVHRCIETLL